MEDEFIPTAAEVAKTFDCLPKPLVSSATGELRPTGIDSLNAFIGEHAPALRPDEVTFSKVTAIADRDGAASAPDGFA
jgi:hypothetical protein